MSTDAVQMKRENVQFCRPVHLVLEFLLQFFIQFPMLHVSLYPMQVFYPIPEERMRVIRNKLEGNYKLR